ncbi:MAG: LLM class flavin-dependent oxidoreductase [Actinomycetota bacterium]|nr:LLM class flavin-dependent oxidoreductase [Actinomycetota bacterium]
MRVGAALQPVYSAAEFGGIVSDIESWGVDELWLTDSSLHAKCCYSFATLAALNSTSMSIGTAVTNPVTRHPAIGAVAAATQHEISGGRFRYGIGAGDRPLLALGYRPARLARLEDAITATRRLWSGEEVTWEASGFTLDHGHIRHGAPVEMPLYVSASGPKTLQLAGRVADGVILLAGLHPEGLQYAISHIERGAEMAGRDRRPAITVFGYGAIHDDEEYALEAGRSIAAWFPQTAPEYCRLAGLPDELAERVKAAYAGGEFQEAKSAARMLPDDFVRRMSLCGNKSVAREHLKTMSELGIECLAAFPTTDTVQSRIQTVRSLAEVAAE